MLKKLLKMNDSEKKILGKIKNLRNQNKLSQKDMADTIGISQTGYANIERGFTENIPLYVAVGIAKTLKVGFNELFEIDGSGQINDNLNSQVKELNERIDDLKKRIEEKEKVIILTEKDISSFKMAIFDAISISSFMALSDLQKKIDDKTHCIIASEIIAKQTPTFMNFLVEWKYVSEDDIKKFQKKNRENTYFVKPTDVLNRFILDTNLESILGLDSTE